MPYGGGLVQPNCDTASIGAGPARTKLGTDLKPLVECDLEQALDSLESAHAIDRIKDKKGEPIANVWVTLPDVGSWTSSNADGDFRFDRLPPGRHRLIARTADGREADSHIEVPGAGVDLVIDGKG